VARARTQQKALDAICRAAEQLLNVPGAEVLAKDILEAAAQMKE